MIRDVILLTLWSAAVFCLAMGFVAFFSGCEAIARKDAEQKCRYWIHECAKHRPLRDCKADAFDLGPCILATTPRKP